MKGDKLWEMMDNKIPNYLLNTIKSIYRNTKIRIKFNDTISEDRLCGLVVRVSAYRYRGLGFDSRPYQIF